jgi:hypothetical protein
MKNIKLNDSDMALALELAELFYYIEQNYRVSELDKARLYAAINTNMNILYKAREIDQARHRKRKRRYVKT